MVTIVGFVVQGDWGAWSGDSGVAPRSATAGFGGWGLGSSDKGFRV